MGRAKDLKFFIFRCLVLSGLWLYRMRHLSVLNLSCFLRVKAKVISLPLASSIYFRAFYMWFFLSITTTTSFRKGLVLIKLVIFKAVLKTLITCFRLSFDQLSELWFSLRANSLDKTSLETLTTRSLYSIGICIESSKGTYLNLCSQFSIKFSNGIFVIYVVLLSP